jgi:hypothetical protein
MNSLENIFLNFGLSWTMAKALPYILALLIGTLLSVLFFRKKNKRLKMLFRLPISVIFFAAYFIFHPIYEGDFSNHSYKPKSGTLAELKNDEFVVVAIPGCMYCMESIEKLNKLKERNPDLKIRFLVLSSDDKDLKYYREIAAPSISVTKAKETKRFLEISKGGFPTFLSVKGGKIMKVWSNDSFGVLALDEVEN